MALGGTRWQAVALGVTHLLDGEGVQVDGDAHADDEDVAAHGGILNLESRQRREENLLLERAMGARQRPLAPIDGDQRQSVTVGDSR